MKATNWTTSIALAASCAAAAAGEVMDSLPDSPDTTARYLIYLHGSGIDRTGVDRAREDFRGNTRALADHGFSVFAEVRPQGAIRKVPEDLDAYARKTAARVEKLLNAQVPARNITIVGYSRGGAIALMVSGFVGSPEVGYVILAGCVSKAGAFKQFVPVLMSDYATKLKGRFLSLVDESDPDFSSCSAYFSNAPGKLDQEETMLRTGKGHELFGEPLDIWIRPLVEWAGAK